MMLSSLHSISKKGFIASSILGALLILVSTIYGKNECFLWANGNGGKMADFFFKYITHLGDGAIFIPLFIWILWKHKSFWRLIILTAVFSTIITQGAKLFLFNGAPRPTKAITDAFIHQVAGVEVHQFNSFPSGHTATAFAAYLLILIIHPSKYWLVFGFILTSLIAYSRVYLAQHFPIDLGAGIFAAVISVVLSYSIIYQKKSPTK